MSSKQISLQTVKVRERSPTSKLLRTVALSIAAVVCLAPSLRAQQRDNALSNAEIEQLRESRLIPAESILLFVKFLDVRAEEIRDLYDKPRRPGREDDTHDLLEQFTSIADELADNLDDYAPRHADLRRALPKIVDGTERWATIIKSPPDNDAYSISRKIALDSIHDLRDSANDLIPDQEVWFKAHPPSKTTTNPQQQNEPITIPR